MLPDFEKAISMAVLAHDGQRRKFTNEPYVMHPLRVARAVERRLKVPAVLHDVLEDTDAQIDGDLLILPGKTELLLRPREAFALLAVTRQSGESYKDFIFRVKRAGQDAVDIKVADICDNIRTLPEGHGLRKRYRNALMVLGADQASATADR